MSPSVPITLVDLQTICNLAPFAGPRGAGRPTDDEDGGPVAPIGPSLILTWMSSPVRGYCAIILLAAAACGPRLATAPSHPTAEARNGVTEKKSRKQRPVVAPPPAYGNKVVIDRFIDEGEQDSARRAPSDAWM
jgi:hypothetical protein